MASEDPVSHPHLHVPPFAERCLGESRASWEASFEHPFVRDLVAGTLTSERFRFYQMQDARYLEAFADTCSVISTRFIGPEDKLWFIDAARLAIVVEGQLHAEYGRRLGYDAQDVAGLDLTPSNLAYQNHMLRAAHHGSLLEAVAALAPCPWLYTDAGDRIMQELGGAVPADHPYSDWISTYADPGFVEYTNHLLSILERLAERASDEERERAIKAFKTSVRYEWMFWEQAYHAQNWPV